MGRTPSRAHGADLRRSRHQLLCLERSKEPRCLGRGGPEPGVVVRLAQQHDGALLVGLAGLVERLVEPLEQRMGVRIEGEERETDQRRRILGAALPALPQAGNAQRLPVRPCDGVTLRFPCARVPGVEVVVRLEKSLRRNDAPLALAKRAPVGSSGSRGFGARVHRRVGQFFRLGKPRDQAELGQHGLALPRLAGLAGGAGMRAPDDGRAVARIDVGFPVACGQRDAELAPDQFRVLEGRVVVAHETHCGTLRARSPTKALATPTGHRGTRAIAVLAFDYGGGCRQQTASCRSSESNALVISAYDCTAVPCKAAAEPVPQQVC